MVVLAIGRVAVSGSTGDGGVAGVIGAASAAGGAGAAGVAGGVESSGCYFSRIGHHDLSTESGFSFHWPYISATSHSFAPKSLSELEPSADS